MALSIVILAAGQGTRMRSSLPKVLHPLAGRPLLGHVIDTARTLGADAIHVVHGHSAEQVRAQFDDAGLNWVLQAEQLGTGHAVEQAMPHIPDDHQVLILYGDVPLTQPTTLQTLLDAAHGANGAESGEGGLALLTVRLADPAGYGRIVRDAAGNVARIVEQKDASAEELAIHEGNTGLLAADAARLRDWIARVDDDNAQKEFYLTDVAALAVADGVKVQAVHANDEAEVSGVNDKRQLADAEKEYRRRVSAELLEAGVTLIDPARIDVRGNLHCGRDVIIDVNAVFEGEVHLGDGVHIGPNCYLRDSNLGAGTSVHANSVLERATTGADCNVGPFARLRPDAVLGDGARIGNFVEIKKSTIGDGSKVNHLSYIGDAEVGSGVNIGAGTITCNYDGALKHATVIEDGAFVGSGTQLIAPVRVGAGAYIGSGSTISRDAPPDKLTLARTRQVVVPGWKRPVKKK